MAGRSWVGKPGWCGQEGFSPTTRPGWTTTRAPRGACPLIRPDSGCEADNHEQERRRRRGEPGKARSSRSDGNWWYRSARARGSRRHREKRSDRNAAVAANRIPHERKSGPGRIPCDQQAHELARVRDRHPSGPSRVGQGDQDRAVHGWLGTRRQALAAAGSVALFGAGPGARPDWSPVPASRRADAAGFIAVDVQSPHPSRQGRPIAATRAPPMRRGGIPKAAIRHVAQHFELRSVSAADKVAGRACSGRFHCLAD